MIVVSPRGMLFEELAHGGRAKVLIDFRAAIQKSVGHFVVDGAAEPIVHHVDGESSFLPLQNGFGKIGAGHLAVQPFPGTIPHFEVGG